MPRPPTHDAKWCLEELFRFLELNLSHRVAAKVGSKQQLELARLSNLMGSAAMSHANKPRTPLSPARSFKIDDSMNINATDRARLREIFIHYCSWAEHHNYLFMSRTQFLRFCRDTRLMGEPLTATRLNLIFDKVCLQSKEQDSPNMRFSLINWLEAVATIGRRLFKDLSSQEALNKVLQERVLSLPPSAAPPKDDVLAPVMLQPDVIEVLDTVKLKLKPIFNYYIGQQDIRMSSPDGRGIQAALKDVQDARLRMPFDAFVRFAGDFDLLPQVLSKTHVSKAFQGSRFGPAGGRVGEDSNADLARIGFDEFVDAVGRLALMAYNYKEPDQKVSALEFTSSYASGAKQLWLDEAERNADEMLMFPDEVAVPGGASVAGGGVLLLNDTSPNDFDDAKSRVQSFGGIMTRTHSVSQYRTKKLASPGLEVMEIHNETEVLQEERPLHLTNFTTDWVGRLNLPLNQTARLRPRARDPYAEKGIYGGPAGADPKYQEAMGYMLDARTTREQHLQALKLNYEAERRAVMKQDDLTRTAQRQQLQATAGQPVVEPLAATRTLGSPTLPALGTTRRTSSSVSPEVGRHSAPSGARASSVGEGAGGMTGGIRTGTLPGMRVTCSTTLIAELQGIADVGLAPRATGSTSPMHMTASSMTEGGRPKAPAGRVR